MKQTTKRKLAREILIFFSCTILIVLTWAIFWTTNKVHKNKAEQLRNQISKLTHNIDSIQTSFPKLKSFKEIITGAVPVEYLIEEKFIPTPEEVLGTDQEKERASNIRHLYKLLQTSEFLFSDNKFIPAFHDFKNDIEKELESDTSKQKLLNKIYAFLKSEKYTTVEFVDFTFCLSAVPLPPKHTTWTTYQDDIKKRVELKNELDIYSSKIYSADDLIDIAKWISIIVLTLVYPFRFLFLLLKWSIKALRQNAN